MPDDLRTRIAAVLRLHQWRATVRMTDDDPVHCTCGMAFGPHHTFDCYREHVADAVIADLGLYATPEPITIKSYGSRPVGEPPLAGGGR